MKRLLACLLLLCAPAVAADPAPATRVNRPHPGYGVLLRPLRADGSYAPFHTPNAYTPLPTDPPRYHKNPAAYPVQAYRAPTVVQTWYVDPAFWRVPCGDLKYKQGSQGEWIERGIWDIGCVCGLGVKLTKNPAEAHVRFHLRSWEWVRDHSRAWRDPFQDGKVTYYATIQPGTRDIYLGDRNKFDLSKYLEPWPRQRTAFKAWSRLVLGLPYGGLPHEAGRWVLDPKDPRSLALWYAPMRNEQQGHAISHPWTADGIAKWGNHGYDAWECDRLVRLYGPAWIYHFQTGLKPE